MQTSCPPPSLPPPQPWLSSPASGARPGCPAPEDCPLGTLLFEYALEAVFVLDDGGRIHFANLAMADLAGVSRGELVGQTLSFLGDELFQVFQQSICPVLKREGHWRGEAVLQTRNGQRRPVQAVFQQLGPLAGEGGNLVGFLLDTDGGHAVRQQLELLAYSDPLTGLPNRMLLADRLGQSLGRAERLGSLLAICYLDLNDFKSINDNFGHATGDRVLVTVARRLEQAVRTGDTVARLGGDEFVLLLHDLASVADLERLLTRLLAGVAEPLEDGLRVSASLGATVYPLDSGRPEELLERADLAMYAAKKQGAGGYYLHLPRGMAGPAA